MKRFANKNVAIAILWMLVSATCAYAIVCEPEEYDAGYNKCLPKNYHLNQKTCPLSSTDPPPLRRATCEGTSWQHVHVGGSNLEWGFGSWCLTVTEGVIAEYGTPGGGCQGDGATPCQMKLKYAGCISGDDEGICRSFHRGQKMTTGTLYTLEKAALSECCFACFSHPQCVSFNYNKADKTCELMSSLLVSDLAADPDIDWFQVY